MAHEKFNGRAVSFEDIHLQEVDQGYPENLLKNQIFGFSGEGADNHVRDVERAGGVAPPLPVEFPVHDGMNPKLLVEFTHKGLLRGLPGLDFAPRKLPFIGKTPRTQPLTSKNKAIPQNHPHGDFLHLPQDTKCGTLLVLYSMAAPDPPARMRNDPFRAGMRDCRPWIPSSRQGILMNKSILLAGAALLVLSGWRVDAQIPAELFPPPPNVRVSSPGFNDPEEVTIAVNPTNPMNLAAGANIRYYYYSTNGGLNWTQGNLTSTYGVWGDPVVTFDALGNLYYGHLSNPPSPGYWIDRIVVNRSTTGGSTWNSGVGVGFNPPVRNQDKEWLVADMTDSPHRNNIYMAWTEFDNYGSSSTDGQHAHPLLPLHHAGLAWSTPVRVSDQGGDCIDEDNTVEGAVPAVGPNGEVYTAWSGPLGIMFDRSTDGGADIRFRRLCDGAAGRMGLRRSGDLPLQRYARHRL